ILPMSVVLQLEAALILLGRAELLWGFAAAMTVAAVILLRMGLAGFSREAMLSREAGGRRPLARAARVLGEAFQDRPSLPRLLARRPGPILVAAAGFPLGAALGYLAGASGSIPAGVALPVFKSLLETAPQGDPATIALGLFVHNLLAITLAAGLGAI